MEQYENGLPTRIWISPFMDQVTVSESRKSQGIKCYANDYSRKQKNFSVKNTPKNTLQFADDTTSTFKSSKQTDSDIAMTILEAINGICALRKSTTDSPSNLDKNLSRNCRMLNVISTKEVWNPPVSTECCKAQDVSQTALSHSQNVSSFYKPCQDQDELPNKQIDKYVKDVITKRDYNARATTKKHNNSSKMYPIAKVELCDHSERVRNAALRRIACHSAPARQRKINYENCQKFVSKRTCYYEDNIKQLCNGIDKDMWNPLSRSGEAHTLSKQREEPKDPNDVEHSSIGSIEDIDLVSKLKKRQSTVECNANHQQTEKINEGVKNRVSCGVFGYDGDKDNDNNIDNEQVTNRNYNENTIGEPCGEKIPGFVTTKTNLLVENKKNDDFHPVNSNSSSLSDSCESGQHNVTMNTNPITSGTDLKAVRNDLADSAIIRYMSKDLHDAQQQKTDDIYQTNNVCQRNSYNQVHLGTKTMNISKTSSIDSELDLSLDRTKLENNSGIKSSRPKTGKQNSSTLTNYGITEKSRPKTGKQNSSTLTNYGITEKSRPKTGKQNSSTLTNYGITEKNQPKTGEGNSKKRLNIIAIDTRSKHSPFLRKSNDVPRSAGKLSNKKRTDLKIETLNYDEHSSGREPKGSKRWNDRENTGKRSTEKLSEDICSADYDKKNCTADSNESEKKHPEMFREKYNERSGKTQKRLENSEKRRCEVEKRRQEKRRHEIEIAKKNKELHLIIQKEKKKEEVLAAATLEEERLRKEQESRCCIEKTEQKRLQEEKKLTEEAIAKEKVEFQRLKQERLLRKELIESAERKLKLLCDSQAHQDQLVTEKRQRVKQKRHHTVIKPPFRRGDESCADDDGKEGNKYAEEMRQAMTLLNKRRKEALLRTAHNIENNKTFNMTKMNQMVSRPNLFSYFVQVPRETWELPIGWHKQPKYKAGGRRAKSS